MQLAMIGLGRMGGNMVQRLLQGGHELVVFDRSADAVQAARRRWAPRPRRTWPTCAASSTPPRVVWIMVPAGAPVDEHDRRSCCPALSKGDIIIDGGNSNFHDSMRRAAGLKERGIEFIDAGTSGGIWGLDDRLLPDGRRPRARPSSTASRSSRTLAPPDGYAHVGPPGAGHYVKMVHNGIEYGMLQAYAEGYEILHASKDFKLDLQQIAAVWKHGSVVRSWLNELAERAFAKDAELSALKGYVDDSGEGRWTVQEAIDLDVPAPVITLSLLTRFRSRQADSFGAKVIAALRNEFGGHAVKTT